MKRIAIIILTPMLALLLYASITFAQGGTSAPLSTDFALSWWTVDGGGGESSGGTYTLVGIIGQPEVGVLMSGGNYTLAGGFWGAGNSSSEANNIYLPLILK